MFNLRLAHILSLHKSSIPWLFTDASFLRNDYKSFKSGYLCNSTFPKLNDYPVAAAFSLPFILISPLILIVFSHKVNFFPATHLSANFVTIAVLLSFAKKAGAL